MFSLPFLIWRNTHFVLAQRMYPPAPVPPLSHHSQQMQLQLWGWARVRGNICFLPCFHAVVWFAGVWQVAQGAQPLPWGTHTAGTNPAAPWCDLPVHCCLLSLLTAHQPLTKTKAICKTCSLWWVFLTADSPPPPCAALNSESSSALLPSEPRSRSCKLFNPKAVSTQIQESFACGPQEAELSPPALSAQQGWQWDPSTPWAPTGGNLNHWAQALSVFVTVYLYFVYRHKSKEYIGASNFWTPTQP